MKEFDDYRWAAFAAVGGAVGYLMRSKKIKAQDLIIESLGAGFVGAIVSMTAKYYGLPDTATGAVVGISALIGARATLTFLKENLLRRFAATNREGVEK